MQRMCTLIGISTSGARPLRKQVHYIDGVWPFAWSLKIGYGAFGREGGIARLDFEPEGGANLCGCATESNRNVNYSRSANSFWFLPQPPNWPPQKINSALFTQTI